MCWDTFIEFDTIGLAVLLWLQAGSFFAAQMAITGTFVEKIFEITGLSR